jgi:hypothetical protein
MFRKFVFILAALSLITGCSKDTLQIEIASLLVTPEPGYGQTALNDPLGLDFGRVPLFSIATAEFDLKNDSSALTRIDRAVVRDAVNGEFVVTSTFPRELGTMNSMPLTIQFTPTDDSAPSTAVVELYTNIGPSQNGIIEIYLTGEGYFVGEPHLEVGYNGVTYPVEGNCSEASSGLTECTLGEMPFGNVPLDNSGTQSITLRNNPLADTCQLPALPDGTPDCTAVCVITFDRQALGRDMGLGFDPDDTGFSLVGSASLPFKLAPAKPGCESVNDGIMRGEIDLLVNFEAGSVERDAATTMVIESDSPNANVIEIPMTAAAREAPIAVAEVRECGPDALTDCSVADEIAPLDRVYLTGINSYDTRDPDDASMIVSYRWEIIDFPGDADEEMFQPTGVTSQVFSMWLPIAGEYTVRLYVMNDVGIESGVSETSDITVLAKPTSRLHLQMVWDTPTTDLDMHFVLAGQSSGEAYNLQWDCYWSNCRPGCTEFTNPCSDPVQWFPEFEIFTGPNPHLDIDDTNGLGPENINVDEPLPASYHVYVHYYAIGSGQPSIRTQSTVRIYGDGVLRAEYRRGLEKNDLWAVGKIVWDDEGNVTVIPALSDDTNVVGAVQNLNYVPVGGDGYDFGAVF